MAFDHASLILSWQENMLKEECPPVEIWASDEAVREWFDDLEIRRETGSGNADITDWEEPTDNWEQNELAFNAKKKLGVKR